MIFYHKLEKMKCVSMFNNGEEEMNISEFSSSFLYTPIDTEIF